MGEETVVIQTRLGQLRGLVKQSILTGKKYFSFRGIPYAKPPLGELRFKAPLPFGGWEGVRDALEDGPNGKQPKLGPDLFPGLDLGKNQEDCLYINVYMNELPTKSSVKLPVMFSIHGGGFICGSGNSVMAGPEHLLYGDVVIVSFNYRLGAFGFLSLGNEQVPGNAGLKDQTLALKWVRDNIDSFGGDPNNVTIFGISAGGFSVGYHLLSSSSRGLFHKAIMQSGFPMNSTIIQKNPQDKATKLARSLGCTSENPDEILLFLQSVPADDIVAATVEMSKDKEAFKSTSLIFSPSVEISGAEPFLTDFPDSLMERGQFAEVPVIIGCCINEGCVVAFFNGVSDEAFATFNENPEWMVPPCLGLVPGSVQAKEAQREIWDFYLKGSPLSMNNIKDYLRFQTDNIFALGMHLTRTNILQKSKAPVYTYMFSNHSKCLCKLMINAMPEYSSVFEPSETCHGADALFIYGNSLGPAPSGAEKDAIKKIVIAWTNFASTGDPNADELEVKWNKDSISRPCYMDIGNTWLPKKGVIFADRMSFWEELRSKYHSS